MGYENAGGAVWLGTKQDLVVRHTHTTANFETDNAQTFEHTTSIQALADTSNFGTYY